MHLAGQSAAVTRLRPFVPELPPEPDRRLDEALGFRGIGRSSSFPFPQYIARDEYETVYFDVGEGETLVFVHGLGANATNWQPILKPLESRYRLVGLDLVGCGWTRKPDREYSIDLLRDHLLDFLDRRGVERATLLGHSMGGAVVLAAALERPGLADRLVLMNAAGICPLPLWMRAGARVALKRQVLVPILGLGANFILNNVFVASPEENEHVRWFRESSMRDAPGFPNLFDFARVCETLCDDVVRRDYSDRFQHVHAPVLVMWGEKDKLIGLSGALSQLDGLRRLRTVVIPRCGHMPMVERPDETLRHLERFFSDPP